MKNKLLLGVAICLASPLAFSHDGEGPWRVTIGLHRVAPVSGNGVLASGALATDVGADIGPTLTVEYFITDNLAIEALAALPFKHDVRLNGTSAARITHLPPTVSAKHYFRPDGKVMPYLGLGLNYTWIYHEQEAPNGPLDGTQLRLANSLGLAAQVGLDFNLDGSWYCGVNARWMDIDAGVSVDRNQVGEVKVDPLVFGLYVGKKF